MKKRYLSLILLGAFLLAFTLTAQAQVEYIIQYDDGTTVYYSGRPQPDDTCGVWFEPPTECQILSGQFQFNNNMGGDALVYIWDIVDGFDPDNYYDSDEPEGAPGPTPLGAVLAGPIPYTFDNSGNWQEIVFDDYGYPPDSLDVGLDYFYIGYVLVGGGAQPYYPSILGDAGDDRPYHSLCWLLNPGGVHVNESGWWAYGIDWMLRARVNLYGDPPPFITELNDPPDTYAAGPYSISCTIIDQSQGGGPGQVTEARLIYSVDGGSETTVMMTNPSGDTYQGSIPAVAADQSINFRVEADDNANHTALAPSLAGYNFTYRQPSGAKILLVNDSGDIVGEDVYRGTLESAGYSYDYWYINAGDANDMGYPGSDVINANNYNTIIWFNGTAHPGNLPRNDDDLATDPVANFMDDGGNFFLSSSDYIGGAFEPNVWTEFTAVPGTFMYEYLKVLDGWSDAHMDPGTEESLDTLHFGVAGDPVGGDFTGGVFSHPSPNYNDYCYPVAGAETCFETEIDNESAGIRYDGAFKMVFLPWVLEACDDPADAEAILLNVLDYFGEGPGPSITFLEGSQYGIYGDTPHRPKVEVTDPEGVSYVKLSVRWDGGSWQNFSMWTTGNDQYIAYFYPPASWETLQYRIFAVNNLGNATVGPTYECWYTGLTHTAGANFLYCSDQPDWGGAYTHVNYDSTITDRLDALSINYDIWDADEFSTPDFWTVLNAYTRCFWVGYLDWNLNFPMSSADNPFSSFLGSGYSLLFSSEEQMGVWTNWVDVTYESGDFAYDWLHVLELYNDKGYTDIQLAQPVDPMCNGMQSQFNLNQTGFPLPSMADWITPVDAATTADLFFSQAPGGTWWSGIRDDVAQHNSVTLGFCLYMMDTANRNTFITNVITYWLSHPGTPVGVEPEEGEPTPLTYQLDQNYPNPFNPATQIHFALPENAKVELKIYNLMGQDVATLLDRNMNAGAYTVNWNAPQFASGIYFYKLKTANFEQSRKMILVK